MVRDEEHGREHARTLLFYERERKKIVYHKVWRENNEILARR